METADHKIIISRESGVVKVERYEKVDGNWVAVIPKESVSLINIFNEAREYERNN